MDGSIEQTLPSALRGLPVAWVLLDVRDETRVEDGFAVTAQPRLATPSRILLDAVTGESILTPGHERP
jgi:hypothetical protein